MQTDPSPQSDRAFSLLLVAIMTAATLSLCTAGCCLAARQQPQPPPYTATFAYFPLAVPVSVLGETLKRDRILERNLRRLGVQLRFQPFARGQEAMSLIRANRVDAVAFGDMPTIEACVTGRMQIVGLAKQGYSSIVAPKGTRLNDLKKKRIGNATASTGHYALLQALGSIGMSEHDLTIMPLNLHEMQPALEQGQIDAFAAWEPIPSATLQANPGRFTVLHRQVSLVYFLLSQQLLDKHPEAGAELTAALIRSIRWMKKSERNLETAANWSRNGMSTFIGKTAEVSLQEIKRITTEELLDIPGIPQLPGTDSGSETLLAKEFSFMQRQHKLPPNAGWEQVRKSFNRKLMVDILKQPASFALNRFEYAP